MCNFLNKSTSLSEVPSEIKENLDHFKIIPNTDRKPIELLAIKYLIGELDFKTLDDKSKEDLEGFINPVDKYYKKINIFDNLLKDIPNINKASEIIKDYIKSNKKILILTDYDSDGSNGAGCAYKLFSYVYKNFNVYINKRRFGNGINPPFIKYLTEEKNIDFNTIDLLITIDHGCGSVPYLTELLRTYPNLKIIITDHHEVLHKIPDDLQDRMLIVNAFLLEEDSYVKKLSGCTIGALTSLFGTTDITNVNLLWDKFRSISDMLAVSVISDVMDVSEVINRLIVKLGLEVMNNEEEIGLSYKFLAHSLGLRNIDRIINLDDIKFSFSPVINSANRLHIEDYLQDIFCNDNEDIIKTGASGLCKSNSDRKEYTNNAVAALLSDRFDLSINPGIVVSINTHYGLNGIIAGKLSELKQKPAICFIEEYNPEGKNNNRQPDDIIHGSCRAKDINILEILVKLKELGLVKECGGHKQACGCSIYRKDLPKFREEFYKLIPKDIERNDKYKVDLLVKDTDVTIELEKRLTHLEPFGLGFETPVFYSEFTIDSGFSKEKIALGKAKVLETVKGQFLERKISLVAFNNGRYPIKDLFTPNTKLGAVYEFKSNSGRNIFPSLKVIFGFTLNRTESLI